MYCKILCINLARRTDRKELMINKFKEANIDNYFFFEAVDGKSINDTHPNINLIKHNNSFMHRKGLFGCSLSQMSIYQQLLNDPENNYYLILEDDVNFVDDFQTKLNKILSQITHQMDVVYLGMTMPEPIVQQTKHIYQYDTSFTIHPMNRNYFGGGAFGYIITKQGAKKVLDYIFENGLKMAFDYVLFRMNNIHLYESHPHLIFTIPDYHDFYVDSDIQSKPAMISISPIINNNIFDDYVFYPNIDSPGSDINNYYSDIHHLKKLADNTKNCIAFNTYGSLKNNILESDKWVNLPNNYYNNDGLYIKKTFLEQHNKLQINNYMFDDYIFCYNKDSKYNNIHTYDNLTIPELKMISDNMNECVGFNTLGQLKYSIVDKNLLVSLKNTKYACDGIYVKKHHYSEETRIKNKIQLLHQIASNRKINIFVNINANKYYQHIVKIILENVKNYNLVNPNNNPDITINYISEEYVYLSKSILNFMISGESWKPSYQYDITIDTKFYNNDKLNIYYPFLFNSLHHHIKSINPLDYQIMKTKFCAYLYNTPYKHREKYYQLLSSYKKTDALGNCNNNVMIKNTFGCYNNTETFHDIAIELYSHYKFVLALENSMVTGYSTEILINPLIAGSLPIYWGDSYIFKYINKKRIIYVPDYNSDNELLEYIKYLDNDINAYNKIVNEPIYTNSSINLETIDNELKFEISKLFDNQT